MFPAVLVVAPTLICTSCEVFSPTPTSEQMNWTPGNASQELLADVDGRVLSGTRLLVMPGSIEIRPPVPDDTIRTSGPDENGTLAVITNPFIGSPSVRLRRADGSETFVWKSSTLDRWTPLSLSSRGEKVAVFAKSSDSYHRELIVFDASTKSRAVVAKDVPPYNAVWLVDDRAMAWLTNTASKSSPDELNVALHRFDDGSTSMLCRSTGPIAPGRDAQHLLAQDEQGAFEIDVTNAKMERLGLMPGAIRLLGRCSTGLVVYEAWATHDEEVWIPSFTLIGPGYSWTVKAWDPASGRFCTLVPRVWHESVEYHRPTVR